MKIDLHCHTKAVKKGDSPSRTVSAVDFKDKVNSACVKIVGITNHNCFDIMQYKEFLSIVDKDFMIWPGIELDVKGIKSDDGHVVIVSNPACVDNFKKAIDVLINDSSPDDFSCSIDQLLDFANSIDCLVIPHFFKPKSLSNESIEMIRKGLSNNYRLLYEPANFRSLGILINHSKNSIIGSDVKDWSQYHVCEFADLKIDVDSYEQFMFLVKKDTALIETLFQNQSTSVIDISYSKSVKENVEFYDDINVFFGSKGTGKSESLDKVKKFFNDKGKNVGYYAPRDTQDKIDEKLLVNENERKLSLYGFDNCEDDFTSLCEWKDENVTQFKDYLNYISSKNKNVNKEKMKLLEITNISNSYNELLKTNNDELIAYKDVVDNIKKIKVGNYLVEDDVDLLNKLLKDLYEKIVLARDVNWRKMNSIKLVNFSIETFKDIVEKNTELKTKPNDTGFLNFSRRRLILKKILKNIIETFSYAFDDDIISIGRLEENKELKRRTVRRMLCDGCKTNEFLLGIQVLKEAKRLFFAAYDHVFDDDVYNLLGALIELLANNKITSMDSFLGIRKCFEINDQEYRPSTGEATMIILDEVLKGDYDVYLLDEPEKSLGNAYVSEVLVPRINDLSKLKKCVVIVTHNANVAVRTFPFRSILKEYTNGEYKTYVGNPYTNKLININDKDDIKDWKSESIRILEGGKEAFAERGEIYGE